MHLYSSRSAAGAAQLVEAMAAGGLLAAARAGDVEEVRRLVAQGCDLEEADAEGDSAVLHAARGGHVEVLNVLLFAGASTRHANMEGTTALLEACHRGHLEAVRFLVEQTRYPDVGRRDVAGRGALICAASAGHAAVVRYLISNQYADLAQADGAGMTALLWAARRGRLGLVRYLAEEAGVRLLQADRSHWTALLWAAYAGHLPVVEYLISEKNASQRQCSREGLTALHCAAMAGRTDVARYLLDFRPDPEQQTRDGSTALLLAASKGRLDTARMLLFERGANLHHRNAAGRSALDLARRKGHAALAEFLVLCSAEDSSDGAWRSLPLGHDLSDAVREEVEVAARAGSVAALWLLHCNGRGMAAKWRHVEQEELLQMCRVGGHPSAVLVAALGEEDPARMLDHVKEARRLAASFRFLDKAQQSFHSATEKRVLSECRFRIHQQLRLQGRQVGAAPSQEVLAEKLLRITADDTLSSQLRTVRETLTAHREGASPAFHSLYYDIMTVMDLVRPLSEMQAPGQTSPAPVPASQTRASRQPSKEETIEAIVKQLTRVGQLLEPPELAPIIMDGEEPQEDPSSSAVEEMGEETRTTLADAVRAMLKHYHSRREGSERKEARIYTLIGRWRRISSAAAKKLTVVHDGTVPTAPGAGLRFHEIVYERPRAPGVEYAFVRLHNELSGLDLLPSCLFVADQDGQRQVMVARPTSGFSLQFLLESHRDLLPRIDMESFGALVLTTLLAPPSNSNWANTAVSLQGDSVRLVATGGSDMGVGDRRVHVHQPGTARQGQPYVRSRCALWFLPQMHEPLHPALRSRLLTASPEETLLSWLAQLEQQHGRFERLINDEAITASQYSQLGLPIRCKQGLVPSALVQLHRVRAYLQEDDEATHWGLFELLAPSLAEYYADVQRKVQASLRPEAANGENQTQEDNGEVEEETKEKTEQGDKDQKEVHDAKARQEGEASGSTFDAELLLACCFETYKDSAPSTKLLQELADNTFDPSAVMAAVAEATHTPSSEQLISVAEAAEELLAYSDGALLDDVQQEAVLRCLQSLSCLRRLHFRNYRRLDDTSLQGVLERAKSYSIAGVKRLRLAGKTSLTVGALRKVLSEYPLLKLEMVHEHCTAPALEPWAIGGPHLDEDASVSEDSVLESGSEDSSVSVASVGDLHQLVDFSNAPSFEALDGSHGDSGDVNGTGEECSSAASGEGPSQEPEVIGKGDNSPDSAVETGPSAGVEGGTVPRDGRLETASGTGEEADAEHLELEVDFSTAPPLEGLERVEEANSCSPEAEADAPPCEEEIETCLQEEEASDGLGEGGVTSYAESAVEADVLGQKMQEEVAIGEETAQVGGDLPPEEKEELPPHEEADEGPVHTEASHEGEEAITASENGYQETGPIAAASGVIEEVTDKGRDEGAALAAVPDEQVVQAEAMDAKDLLLLLQEFKGRAVVGLGTLSLSISDLRKPRQLPHLVKQGEADEWTLLLFSTGAVRPWQKEASDALAAAVGVGNSPLAAALLAALPPTDTLLCSALAAKRGACVAELLRAGACIDAAEADMAKALAEAPSATFSAALGSLLADLHCEAFAELLLRASVTDVQALQLVPSAGLLSRVTGMAQPAARCLLSRAACFPVPAPMPQAYQRRALVVAVATEHMRYAEVDGTRLALLLQERGFSTRLLAGAAARKETVLDSHWRLLQAPTESGVDRGLAIFFIGEAWQDGQQTTWLRLAGFEERRPATTGIDVASWVHAANDSGARHVFNALDYWGAGADCCMGLMDSSSSLSQGPPLEQREELLARPGRCLLTAALPADERAELLHAQQSGTVAAALLELLRHGDTSLPRQWMSSEELAAGAYRILREADCPCQIYVANQGEGSLVFDA